MENIVDDSFFGSQSSVGSDDEKSELPPVLGKLVRALIFACTLGLYAQGTMEVPRRGQK